MNLKKYFKGIAVSSILLLTGCFGLWDSGSEDITGKYIVLWIDLPANQSISEQFETGSSVSSTVVAEYVFAVGHNDDFIIAKQHPTNGFEGGFKVNPKITNYFIIDINQKVIKKGNNVWGPLSRKEFDEIRKEIRIEDIEFDQVYPDHP